jgi:hypothetical protein
MFVSVPEDPYLTVGRLGAQVIANVTCQLSTVVQVISEQLYGMSCTKSTYSRLGHQCRCLVDAIMFSALQSARRWSALYNGCILSRISFHA